MNTNNRNNSNNNNKMNLTTQTGNSFITPERRKKLNKAPALRQRSKGRKEKNEKDNKGKRCRRRIFPEDIREEKIEQNKCEKVIEGILLILLVGIVCILYVSLSK
jgi:hypothetical protein